MIRKLLTLLALLVPAIAHAEWHEASSDHFVVYSDDSPERITRFTEKLERFDRTLRYLTKVPGGSIGPANRVTVYVVDGTTSIQRLSGRRNVAGFYIPRAGGSVAFVPRRGGSGKFDLDAEEVLFHEYTHHFMLSNFADAAFPKWFVEGFAEFFATVQMRPDGAIWVGTPPLYRAYAFAHGTPVSVARLVGGDADDSDEAIYAQGWLLTHMLHFDRTRKGQLGAYMDAINEGRSPKQAAEAFGDARQLERDLGRYMRDKLSYVSIPATAVPVATVRVRPLTRGEAAVMDVRIRSKRGVNRKAALALLPAARRAAAPFPADPAAQVALAEAEYDAGNYPLAEAAARRTIAADPKSVDGHVYLGMARMAQAAAGKVTDAKTWRDIRQSFLAANAIDTEDPEPLMLFYNSFHAAGQEPTDNAMDALIRAHQLGPQDTGLRMTTAAMLMRDDRGPAARQMLAPIAYAPHGGGIALAATALIAAFDSGGAKAAVALMDQQGDAAESDSGE